MEYLRFVVVFGTLAVVLSAPVAEPAGRDIVLHSSSSPDGKGFEYQSVTSVRQKGENNHFLVDGKEVAANPILQHSVQNVVASALSPLQMFNPSPYGMMPSVPMGYPYGGYPYYGAHVGYPMLGSGMHGMVAPTPMNGPVAVGYVQVPVYAHPSGGYTMQLPTPSPNPGLGPTLESSPSMPSMNRSDTEEQPAP